METQLSTTMPRSPKQQSSSTSFTKFVARLQTTFASKNAKSSTVIMQQRPSSRIPTFSNRFHLSEILYDPSRPIEYLSEIHDKTDSDSHCSSQSNSTIQDDQINLSQMNISYYEHHHHSPVKLLKLPNSFNSMRLHSTAINDLTRF